MLSVQAIIFYYRCEEGQQSITQTGKIYLRNNSWKPYYAVSFNMGWQIKFTNILPTHFKLTIQYGCHKLFQFDMYNSTNMVVYFDGKDSNLYLRLRAILHTINAAKFGMCFYDGKVSLIDGVSIALILCLHFLIAHLIFINLDLLIIFSEYRCLKRQQPCK